jgi:hypothetical protein
MPCGVWVGYAPDAVLPTRPRPDRDEVPFRLTNKEESERSWLD